MESKAFFCMGSWPWEKESSCPLDAELCTREALRQWRPSQTVTLTHDQVHVWKHRCTGEKAHCCTHLGNKHKFYNLVKEEGWVTRNTLAEET
jgi:hypothetical protein